MLSAMAAMILVFMFVFFLSHQSERSRGWITES